MSIETILKQKEDAVSIADVEVSSLRYFQLFKLIKWFDLIIRDATICALAEIRLLLHN